MKIHKTGNGTFAVETMTYDKNTDTKEVFQRAFNTLEKQDLSSIKKVFKGVDLGRSIFLSEFGSEQNFLDLPTRTQAHFAKAVQQAVNYAMTKGDMLMANGFSLFVLWLTSIVFDDEDAKKYIEEKLAKIRIKHDL